MALLLLLTDAASGMGAPLDDARALIGKGQMEQAQAVLDAVLAEDPGNREARLLAANLLSAKGQVEEAYRLFHELLAENSKDGVANAVRVLFRRTGASAEDARRVQALMAQAQAAAGAQKWDTVVSAFAEVVDLAPGNTAALNVLVQTLEFLQRFDEAAKYQKMLVAERPRDIAARNRLAGLYQRAGMLEEAIAAYEDLLKRRPGDVESMVALARLVMLQKRDYARGADILAKVLKDHPKHVEAAYLLGIALQELGDKEGALAAFSQAAATDETHYLSQYQKGVLLEEAGRRDEAMAAFRKVIEHGGNSPAADQARRRFAFGASEEQAREVRALLEEGATLMDQGDLDAAKARFERVVALVPENALAHYNLATIHSRQGRSQEAIRELKEALRHAPRHFLSHYGLALIYTGEGRFEEAFESLKNVVRFAPRTHPVYQDAKRKVEGIMQYLQQARGQAEAQAAFREGISLVEQKEFEQALAKFEKAIELDSSNAFYHYNAGILYVELNRLEDAYKAFKEAVRLKPDHVQSHFRLGLFYEVAKLPQEALDSYRKVIEYGTNEPEVAEARRRLQVVEAGADDREKALGHLILGNALAALGERDQALAAFERAERHNPTDRGVLLRLAEMLMRLGRSDEAQQRLEIGIKEHPDFSRFHFLLAQVYDGKRDLEKAESEFHEALRLQPDSFPVVEMLARFLVREKRADEGISLLREYVEAHPDNEQALLSLGNLLTQMDRATEAATLYDWYLTTHEETPIVLIERGQLAAKFGSVSTITPTAVSDGEGVEGDAGTTLTAPRYQSAEEWYRRAIAIASPQEAELVRRAQLLLEAQKRLNITFTQTVLDFNTNANNSATDPKAGASSSMKLGISYVALKRGWFSLPITFSTDHQLHYTFQTYVNHNDLRFDFLGTLGKTRLTSGFLTRYTQTHEGRTSITYITNGGVTGQFRVPQTLRFQYTRTDFVSFVNANNNYLNGAFDFDLGHAWSVGANTRLNSTFSYNRTVLNVLAEDRDTDKTTLDLTGGFTRTLSRRRTVVGSLTLTTADDVRQGNVRDIKNAAGAVIAQEVVPIRSYGATARSAWTFWPYPNVQGTFALNVSSNQFYQGIFRTFPNVVDPVTGNTGPLTTEVDERRDSVSASVTFIYRPDERTTWNLDIRQVENRVSVDTPANVDEVLTDQVVQDNINRRQQITLSLVYRF